MLKVFDWHCKTTNCKNAGKEIEYIAEVGYIPLCELCFNKMENSIPAPKGYVKNGTSNKSNNRRKL